MPKMLEKCMAKMNMRWKETNKKNMVNGGE